MRRAESLSSEPRTTRSCLREREREATDAGPEDRGDDNVNWRPHFILVPQSFETSSPSSSETSPPAVSAPVSGGAVSIDPVEATPPLPASEGVSSPAPLAQGGACHPKPLPAPRGDLPPASGRKPAPSPGDASRFLKIKESKYPYLRQCTALLSSGECCEKIFCNPGDIKAHMLNNHGTYSFEFSQTFFIDAHDNLYIL